MADGGVHGAPYDSALALARWVEHRNGYLRGRLLLAGVHPSTLNLADWLDVAEAALVEGPMHGAWLTLDDSLDKLAEAIAMLRPNVETWGTTPRQQQSLRAAEAVFGQASPRRAPGESTVPP